MYKNRLQLDWTLETKPERSNFLHEYLAHIKWTPTEEELEMMSKYILWGKTPETGLNGRQEGLQLDTVAGTWDTQQIESLDALTETPGFNEAHLHHLTEPPSKKPRTNFSRTKARRVAPPDALAALEALWTRIDTLDLTLNLYEERIGKKTTPIRSELLNADIDIASAKNAAARLTPFRYLKLRHELVDLRRQQYGIKDTYCTLIESRSEPNFNPVPAPTFGDEIVVMPLGLKRTTSLDERIFCEERFPIPSDFSAADLQEISRRLWRENLDANPLTIDLRDPTQLSKLFGSFAYTYLREEVQDIQPEDLDTSLLDFWNTISYYRKMAHLEPFLEDLLDLKIQGHSNQFIADTINSLYSKTYKPNYISTLYHKKCLGAIAEVAAMHREVLENCFFPENFKVCKDCGQTFLLNERNFVRRARSNDGFSPRCKKCEKVKRDEAKRRNA